ncbi:MATE family efflux transporter [Cloacibacillus sp.]|uniref:MATE family efflux transporter n=1 Tax=Cloacibacillus sp. TaxID=2049023 RepID=UPI0025C6269A|nr:MATE family efflux transporter [Cloacibacillus sp.]MCC8058526.1 polysaccharide biosynthesis C-terminal domain-containing protein [Cloacibacillus sp.]
MRHGAEALEREELRGLMRAFCLPSLAASLVTALYNIVDQIFIGRALGVAGNAAANVVFPAVTVITALSLMCGVGSSAVMNLALGRGDNEQARRGVAGGFVMMAVCGMAVSLAMLCRTVPLLRLFGCTDTVMPYAAPYAQITAFAFVCAMIGAAGPFLVRADGSPNYALCCTAVGTLLNLALDALFINVFAWGIAGAAWATALAQTVSAAMVILYLPRFRTLRLRAADFLPDFRLYVRIAALGAGPMCNFFTQAVVQVFLNAALKKYGASAACGSDAALAAAGVANKVNTLAAAVVTGLTNGMQPIVSYNFGRGSYARVREAGIIVVKQVLAVSFCIFLCYQLLPRQITALFGVGTEAYFDFASRFFRIFMMLIFLSGLQSSVGGFFSAQGMPLYSIFISVTRQLIFLPPLLVLLPRHFGLSGVLWAGPAADIAMAAAAAYLMARRCRRLEDMQRAADYAKEEIDATITQAT